MYGESKKRVSGTLDSENEKKADALFPSLAKYKQEHSAINLKKLCVEVTEFIRHMYASTENESERDMITEMLQDLPQKKGK